MEGLRSVTRREFSPLVGACRVAARLLFHGWEDKVQSDRLKSQASFIRTEEQFALSGAGFTQRFSYMGQICKGSLEILGR